MQGFTVSVRKLTDEDLMHEACESTFIGTSKCSLETIYKSEHSPARTQLFWITIKNVKLFVSTHLIRHHVGSIPFQLSCRTDRRGGNPAMVPRCEAIKDKLKQANSVVDSDPEYAKSLVGSSIEEVEWLEKNADRNTPVNLSLLVNAQSLIDMAKLRLCMQASIETREIFQAIKKEITKIDPSLGAMMVRKCVYRCGLCGEPRCCGFNNSPKFIAEMKDYASHFSEQQRGYFCNLLSSN